MVSGNRPLIRACAALVAMAVVVGFAAAPLPAGAQARPPAERAAPYDDQLVRLAEILGAVHYLRNLCGAENEDQVWRDKMQALIDAEQPSPARRARFVDGFNRGYRGHERTHAACTDASRLLADRFVREGAQIAAQVASRYAN